MKGREGRPGTPDVGADPPIRAYQRTHDPTMFHLAAWGA